MDSGFALQCPSCHAGYLLPRHLLGARGAHVTCPECGFAFAVSRDGELQPAAEPAASEHAPSAAPPAFQPVEDAPAAERQVAAQVLDELDQSLGEALRIAARDGQLFALHGPDLLGAYDEYRRRAGTRAGAAAFRIEVHARFGVELFPLAEARR